MIRPVSIFTLLVLAMMASSVLAETVQVVRAVRSHTVLAEEDLTMAAGTVPGALEAIEDAIGLETQVALYPGRPIMPGQLGAPALVERNAMVRMRYISGPLQIMTDGRALDRAAVGEAVRVMNLTSRQTVTGTVAADGSVEVGP